jgi:hypothetical protein
MVHVLNAPSPAATASLAIGKEIADRILGQRASTSTARMHAPTRSVVGL